jgi:hypothetical protein
VFQIATQTCEPIAALNAPSANSCAVAYGENYVLKFGGVLNKTEGNNLIEMYTLVKAGTTSARTGGVW